LQWLLQILALFFVPVQIRWLCCFLVVVLVRSFVLCSAALFVSQCFLAAVDPAVLAVFPVQCFLWNR
jgi:hypothetical protein